MSHDRVSPLNLYNNTRIRRICVEPKEATLRKKTYLSPRALTSRVVWHSSDKGWSSDFPPLPCAFSPKRIMAFMLRSHNGVHCCGTVGDSHSHSQLSTAKCTFTGNSFFRIARQRYKEVNNNPNFYLSIFKRDHFLSCFLLVIRSICIIFAHENSSLCTTRLRKT